MFMTSQIQTTAVMLTSVQVITTKNTSSMTRHLGRDFSEQQVIVITRHWSGRCGPWSLLELITLN